LIPKIRAEKFFLAPQCSAWKETMMAGRPKKKAKAGYMISAVADLYKLHPQTLRLYERVGLLKPSRSQGNTRLYTDSDLERLEVILNLTRELGVNLAGIEIILNMRDKMADMQSQMEAFIKFVRNEMTHSFTSADNPKARHAIVRAVPRPVLRIEK
jgi:MerR family transcriptional regulator/heat shock protein HspR